MYKKIVQVANEFHIYEYQYTPYCFRHSFRSRKPPIRRRILNSQRSEANIRVLRGKFKRLLSCNLYFSSSTAFLTLTHADNVDLWTGNCNFSRFQRAFCKIFPDVRYVCVPEFQSRGSVHYHLILFNFPSKFVVSERQTRFIANLWGNGFVDLVAVYDKSPKIVSYMSKYFTKSLVDDRLKGKKSYFGSRNLIRPSIIKSQIQIDYIKEIWGIDLTVDNSPCKVFQYDTQWLGHCDYSLLKV